MYSYFAASVPPKQPADPVLRLASRLPAWVLALAVAVIVLMTAAGLDFLLAKRPQSFLASIDASSCLAALVAGLLFYRMLWYERQRRKAIRRRLEIIAEMNHHVRNAIETIMLSAKVPHYADAVKAIEESVQRVDWALTEILPKL